MMIPITRKEKYINEIVGGGDTAPKTPQTREEFFFADILGEVIAPSPITRIEKYLAKIANKYNGELPEPVTRIERFLARAAGMNVSIPTPITREEIFWSNYSAIVDFEVEGVPPLTYKAIEGTLENYRIYGNTVNGENVGDLITEGEHAGEYKVPVTVEGKNLLPNNGMSYISNAITATKNDDGSVTISNRGEERTQVTWVYYNSEDVLFKAGTQICISTRHTAGISFKYSDNTYSGSISQQNVYTIPKDVIMAYSQFYINADKIHTLYPMIRKADIEDDTYEPYHAPITTPIYLPEPIKMVGDEAEYVDYKEQKQHRVRKNLLQNTATSQTRYGVTFTVNSDGTVSVNGIVTETVFFRLKSDVSYPFDTILSGCAQGGSRDGYYLRAQSTLQTLYSDYGNGALIPANAQVFIEIRIQKGTECNNLEFKPMIRKADIEDVTYEPYIENTGLDVTLPALPTMKGTNELSVGTAVQPSKVYVKYKGERQ